MAQEIYHRSEWGNPTEQWGNVYLNADLTNELYKRASEYENSWVTDQLLNGVGTKPSIILTPTAYEDGVLNSVKPAKTFGSELVTNGTFDTDTDWSKGTGWSIANGNASYDGSGTGYQYILQSITTTSGSIYKINFDVLSSTGTNLNIVDFGAVRLNLTHLNQGNYTFYAEADSTSENLAIYANGTDTFSIDNVSVKEVGQNWTFGTGWSMGDGVAVFDTTSNSSFITNLNISSGNLYRLKIEGEVTSGNIKLSATSGLGNDQAISLPFEQEITHDGGANTVEIRTIGSAEGFISNVSVIEITDDTDLPRINYKDGEGSLLLENQSTNLITYSEDFTQWTRNTTNIDTPSNITQTNPSGESESGFININNGVSATKFIYKLISTTSSIHTQSVFFKYHSRQWIQLVSGGTSHYANFDIQNGVVGNVSGCTATIKDYGNGWYKCTATLTSAATPINIAITVIDDDATTRIPVCTGTGSYYVWGAQVEALSYATSYIPTSGSTVTRLADVCKNSGNSDLINSTEGVLYAEISAFENDTSSRDIYLSDGTANNRIRLRFDNSNNLNVLLYNGSVQVATTQVITDATSFNKIAFKYKVNDFALWVNGTEIFTDTSGTVCSGLNDLSFFATYVSTNNFYGNVKCVAVFKEALSDTELQKLTTI